MGWCRCATACSQAEQLFARKWFPATILRPRTAFTFRVLKLSHLLNHIARTSPWDFAGTMHRVTDHVCTTEVTVRVIFFIQGKEITNHNNFINDIGYL
ncbi:hypothetical protein M422DRAFT_197035 [Sphaerobolus stellatus SS14]|uniref:CxC2-like cysteine cluster KDZ transposase-associated domain-containing protein n=1 Tax=Sphaerobolus stellatus (strain SS14) TaxID=990650 RepID=A0A0C9UAL6_SPHS4|nr:hypothetical protein M422DRAFT_197035 [Sphaerobolus stellatus SS14]